MTPRSAAGGLVPILVVLLSVAGPEIATAQQKKPVGGAEKSSRPEPKKSAPSRDKESPSVAPPDASADDKESPGNDTAETVRDIDIKSVEDLHEMSQEDIRQIAITRDFTNLADLHRDVTKAVYAARLGIDIDFDAAAKAFALAYKFKTKDAAMEVMLNIAEPDAVHFTGVLADPNSKVEKYQGGYRIVLRDEFQTIVPGDEERKRIAAVIEADRIGRQFPPRSNPLPRPASKASVADKGVAAETGSAARDPANPQLTDILDPRKKTAYLTEKQSARVHELVQSHLPDGAEPDLATHDGCVAFRKALREAAAAQKTAMHKLKSQSGQAPDEAYRTAFDAAALLKLAEKALDGLEVIRRRQKPVEDGRTLPAKK